jgi:hypothetical protein
MRVIVIKSEGHDHLKILKRLAVGENSLLSNNHTLPMIAELQFEDIILGVFPKVGAGLRNAYGSWTKNSVGDIIDMVMQMLEVSFRVPTALDIFNTDIKGTCIYPQPENCTSCECSHLMLFRQRYLFISWCHSGCIP